MSPQLRALRLMTLPALLVIALASHAAAQSVSGARGCSIPDFPAPVLCARAGLDTVHASYILLVDESGSMAPLWPTVKRALAEFAQAIPDGDELDVRLFSGSVRTLTPPVPASPAARSTWVSSISSLQPPRGARTDLGRAAEAALAQIKSAPAGRLQFLFLLTDGQQDPDASSPFPVTWGGRWPALAADAALLTSARPLSIAIIRLTPTADNSLLARAFPDAITTDVIGPDALSNWFTSTRRQVAVAKLASLIRHELSQPVAHVEGIGRIVLHGSRQGQHPVNVTARRNIVSTVLVDSSAVRLHNGTTVTPSMSLWTTHDPSLAISGSPYHVWVPPASVPQSLDESVPIRTRLEPTDELQRIGISPDVRPDSLHVQVAALAGGPLSAWLYYSLCGLLVLAALLVVRLAKRGSHRARLDGRVIVRGADLPGVTHALKGRELKSFVVPSATGRKLIRLDARNERGRTVVYATPLSDGVTLHSKPLKSPAVLTCKAVFAAGDDEVTYLLS